jgi:hypothetical protein
MQHGIPSPLRFAQRGVAILDFFNIVLMYQAQSIAGLANTSSRFQNKAESIASTRKAIQSREYRLFRPRLFGLS